MNTTWTNGYQTAVNYTYGYYQDLSPTFQKFCLLLNGVDTIASDHELAHCELGFGQGVSITIHAASHDTHYFGTDFNPAHAAHANQLATSFQSQPHTFLDDSFAELLARSDLPLFDSISLHGIWSWISHENQHIILQFIRKQLKPNGIVYISYNCLTGWAANMPVRELFLGHFNANTHSANPVEKVTDSLNFCEDLLKRNSIFAQRNPNALPKVIELKSQNPHYLIHEYLNQDWQCFSFTQIAKMMEEIKLNFAGSTSLNTHLNNINFTDEQSQFLESIEEPIFKEQCRDYFANTQFRKDLFVRGKNLLTAKQIQTRLRQTSFILLSHQRNIPNHIVGLLGKFDLIDSVYTPLGEVFEKNNYQPLTLTYIEEQLAQLNYNQLLNAMVILCYFGIMQPCKTLYPADIVIKNCQKLNQYMVLQANFHQNYQVLASPITGAGIPTDYFSQLFYRAYFIDNIQAIAHDLADYVQQALEFANWHILDEHQQSITDRTKSIQILQEKAQAFLDNRKLDIAQHLKLF